MQPTPGDVNFDQLLTNISVAYVQDTTRFIFNKVFPIIPVDKSSGTYATYTENDWFRDEAKVRAAGDESEGSGYTISSDTYNCALYAMHKDIADPVRRNAESVFNLDKDATQLVTMKLLLKQEIKWTTDFFATSKWGTDVVGNVGYTKWSNFANSDPMGDVATGKQTVLTNTGFEPNTLVLGYQAFETLKRHPDFVDRVKYSSSDAVTEELLARLLGVNKVFVAKAVKATNIEGATSAYSLVQGDNALLCYVAPNPGLLVPSAGYTFSWNFAPVGQGIAIKKIRIEQKEVDRIEGQVAWDNKIIGSDLGYFFSDTC